MNNDIIYLGITNLTILTFKRLQNPKNPIQIGLQKRYLCHDGPLEYGFPPHQNLKRQKWKKIRIFQYLDFIKGYIFKILLRRKFKQKFVLSHFLLTFLIQQTQIKNYIQPTVFDFIFFCVWCLSRLSVSVGYEHKLMYNTDTLILDEFLSWILVGIERISYGIENVDFFFF